jgi:hypothetical protein
VLDPGGLDVIIRQLAADDLAAIDADGAPRLDGGRIWPLEV